VRDSASASFTSSSRPAMASTICGSVVGEICLPANSSACIAFSVAGTSWLMAPTAGSSAASAIR
jgi:hypothetical protein